MAKQEEIPDVKVVAKNKKATYLYSIEERIEAGIALQGSEVKSLRAKNVDISDAYAVVKEGEAFLFQAHIAEYKNAGYRGHDPKRVRKLLLHSHEIRKLRVKLVERGFTLIPLLIYFRKGKAKLLLGLARGRKKFDRRRAIKEKDMKKAMRREKDY